MSDNVSKRKPGRPRKAIGLASPASLKRMVHGTEMREVRSAAGGQEEPLLLHTREGSPTEGGSGRIFGAADGPNDLGPVQLGSEGSDFPDPAGVRPGGGITPGGPGADEPGAGVPDDPTSLTAWLKIIALETAAAVHQDDPLRKMMNIEVLARKVMDTALAGGMQSTQSRALVIDRLEGKAGRAAAITSTNKELDDQLDRAAINALNELAGAPTEESPPQQDTPPDELQR